MPINQKALCSSPTRYVPVLTNADTGEPITPACQPDIDFYEMIKATSALPGLFDQKIRLGEQDYVDGGMVDALPVQRAVELGASDLVVTTNNINFRRAGLTIIQKTFGRLLARNQSAIIRSRIGKRDDVFNNAMDIIQGKTTLDGLKRVWVVSPDIRTIAGLMTFDKAKLEAATSHGEQDFENILDFGPTSSHTIN